MAWTASLLSAEKDGANSFIRITLKFTSDSNGETQTRSFLKLKYDAEETAIYAQSVITELEGRDTDLEAIKPLIGSPIQLPRDGFQTPNADAAAAARAEIQKVRDLDQQLARLNTLQSAASAGLIAADDPLLVAAQPASTATAAPAQP